MQKHPLFCRKWVRVINNTGLPVMSSETCDERGASRENVDGSSVVVVWMVVEEEGTAFSSADPSASSSELQKKIDELEATSVSN